MTPLELAVVFFSIAVFASAISVRLGVTTALVELVLGVLFGNLLHLNTTDWLDFMARFGAVLLTFIAGLEVSPKFLKRQWKASLTLGTLSFLGPLILVTVLVLLILGWGYEAAIIAGISLSTASIAIIYSQLVDRGISKGSLGRLVMSSAFTTDLFAVLALSIVFIRPTAWLLLFIAVSLLMWIYLPRLAQWFSGRFGKRTLEIEVKLIFLCLLILMQVATLANGRAVLSAFLLGSVMSSYYVRHADELNKLRTVAFSFVTPIFFIKTGILVSLGAVWLQLPTLVVLVAAQIVAKLMFTYPAAMRIDKNRAAITSLMLAPGLSIGLVAAVYGLSNNIIDDGQFSVLVSTIIVSAIIPTAILEKKLLPNFMAQQESEEFA